MEFLVQKETGIPVDLRNLAAINDITIFREMCGWLEMQLQMKLQQETEQVLIPALFDQDFSYYFEMPA